ncbi:MAG: hypothetical protein KF886_21735 [Candidatus Hydrogenedentes bacterium]|nr:hypothetical protein [Candidatus Hydrogenedentota bacterium]
MSTPRLFFPIPTPLLAASVLLLASTAAQAAPPAAINVHGQLLSAEGLPVAGARAFVIQFHDAQTGGAPIGGAIAGTVDVSADGLFNLAVEPPAAILNAAEVWYEIGIDTDEPADNDASDDLFPSRIRVYSVPFALQANEALSVDASGVGSGSVDNAELDALDGVTGNVQMQIDAIDTSGIAANSADIAQNTTDIATNSTSIATNTADITTNAANIAANSADIAQNTTDIATNTTNIATNTADIALKANSADVYSQAAADTAFVDASGDTMSGALGVDAINEATADAGVTIEGVALRDSFVELAAIAAPADTASKLYNVGGSLFFNGIALGGATVDKDAINNSGTLGFDWADGEIADNLTIQGGSVDNDSFSAISDLIDESAIGTGAGQVAAGNHGHMLQDLGGVATDAQIANNLTIQGGTVNNDSFSAISDLVVESAIGTSPGQVAAGNHGHLLQDLGGAVTDAQVPDTITIRGVSAADDTAAAPAIAYASDPNTGIHRPGADQLALVAGGAARLSVDTAEVNILGNILEIASGSAPGTTTNKLYNASGDLFWNGTQLNAGGGGGTDTDTMNWTGYIYDFGGPLAVFRQSMTKPGTIISFQVYCGGPSHNATVDLKRNGSTILSTSPAAFVGNTLVTPNLASNTFVQGDVLEFEVANATSDLLAVNISIVVEY